MSQQTRSQQAQQLRLNAAQEAASRPVPSHRSNGEELAYRRGGSERSYIANFTKGLPHDSHGLLLNPPDYRQFIQGIQSGDPRDIENTPLGPANLPLTAGTLSDARVTKDAPATAMTWTSSIAKERSVGVRAWESEAAGLLFDLQGPDAQAVTMPPAPRLDSDELCAEMAELYLMALLRDAHFSTMRDSELGPQHAATPHCDCPSEFKVEDALKTLQQLAWFKQGCCQLNDEQRRRHRGQGYLTAQNVFRGTTPGCQVGPHISQFLLIGDAGMGKSIADGRISYGAVRVDQRVRRAQPCKDYMTTFEAWLDVQNGADLRGLDSFETTNPYRFISTPRDLATYVHFDALYEAYLNACLILLSLKAPLDPGLPFQRPDVEDKQQGFASFGGPHILSLVTEVATRALKAVRYQKFNVHRRLRPEALAGLIDRYKHEPAVHDELRPLDKLVGRLDATGLLGKVMSHNQCQNRASDRARDPSAGKPSLFLPMAFPEGSPMHPSYGAGHATVAGACTTILKAFFDHGWELRDGNTPIAYEANQDGTALTALTLNAPLTVEGELNKLAANIGIGRDWGGVHYFTDYIESLRLGEQIALGILSEQRLCYGENFTMTVPLIDGSVVRI